MAKFLNLNSGFMSRGVYSVMNTILLIENINKFPHSAMQVPQSQRLKGARIAEGGDVFVCNKHKRGDECIV